MVTKIKNQEVILLIVHNIKEGEGNNTVVEIMDKEHLDKKYQCI